jgi:hypothetical protein
MDERGAAQASGAVAIAAPSLASGDGMECDMRSGGTREA